MKRKQKTYNTEQSIVKEIDAIRVEQSELVKFVEESERTGKQFIRTGNKEDVKEGTWRLEQAGIASRKIDRLESKLVKLKDALAEFRTETIPFIIPDKRDRQVVLK